MKKAVLVSILVLMVVGALSVTADGPRANQSVAGVHSTKNITPTSFASMDPAERRAAAQAMKDAESAAAGPGFQGTLKTGTQHDVPVSKTVNISITYDTGTFTGVGTQPASPDNFTYGNNFDTVNGTGIGGAKGTVTISQLTAFMAIVNSSTTASGNAFVTIFGPPAGSTAPGITSVNVGSLMPGTFNVMSVGTTLSGTNLGFVAGVWNPTAVSGAPCANDCVGFDSSGTVNGQGFHGVALQDINGMDFTPITNANAMLRATGNLIPVELQTFSVD